MKYPGWEIDAELEGEYQQLLAEGIGEDLALEITTIQESNSRA